MTGTCFGILLNPGQISYVGCSNSQANKLAKELHVCAHSEPTRTGGSGSPCSSPWLLASAPVTIWWEQEDVLAPFQLGNEWPGDSHERCHGGSCHSSSPQRGSPSSPSISSAGNKQCAQHRSQVWMNESSINRARSSLNATHVLLWSASQMGTCKLSHRPNTWHYLTSAVSFFILFP